MKNWILFAIALVLVTVAFVSPRLQAKEIQAEPGVYKWGVGQEGTWFDDMAPEVREACKAEFRRQVIAAFSSPELTWKYSKDSMEECEDFYAAADKIIEEQLAVVNADLPGDRKLWCETSRSCCYKFENTWHPNQVFQLLVGESQEAAEPWVIRCEDESTGKYVDVPVEIDVTTNISCHPEGHGQN